MLNLEPNFETITVVYNLSPDLEDYNFKFYKDKMKLPTNVCNSHHHQPNW